MSESKDYYSILGLDRNASEQDIKNAFRNLSKKYHPDVNKSPDAETKFKEVNEAYQVLSDPEKKQQYDMFGTADGNGNFDPFEDFDPFGMFRNAGRQQEVKERGTDLRITVNITMKEAYEGVHKKIKIKKQCACHRCHGSGSEDNAYNTCPACNGTRFKRVRMQTRFGYSENISPCDRCGGTGRIISKPCMACGGTGLENGEKEVEFDIPKGMPFDAYFTLQGEGNDGPHRGIPGNLMIIVQQAQNDIPGLKRVGNDLMYTLKLNYFDFVYGCDVSVPHFNGEQKIHIAEGTESGKELSLYRKGFPDPNDPSVFGNYKIKLECDIPKLKDLNSKQKAALQKCKDLFK